MSLNGARAELVGALEGASIATFHGWGVFTAPCARVFPGEPWVALGDGQLGGRRRQRWEIWAVAGRTDSNASFEDVEVLVQAIDAAMEPYQKWAHLEWRRPAITNMSGAQYFACRGVIETLTEVS